MGTPVWISVCKQSMPIGQECPAEQIQVIETTVEQLSNIQNGLPNIDSADVAQVFSAGFGVVVLFFMLGRGVGQVLRLIRSG